MLKVLGEREFSPPRLEVPFSGGGEGRGEARWKIDRWLTIGSVHFAGAEFPMLFIKTRLLISNVLAEGIIHALKTFLVIELF